MTLTIYAVGDIMLGNQPLCYNFGVNSVIKKKGYDYLFWNITSILEEGDIVIGNLEAPLSHETNKKGFDANVFRADPDVVKGLKNAHFNVLSVANNHMAEHGEEAFLSTVTSLEEHDIVPVGVMGEPKILVIKNYTIAIMAYSFIEDTMDTSLYNKIDSEKKIVEDIKKIRDSVDLIILLLHWGHEYIPFPSSQQIEVGRKLVESGADIILGAHPHVIQGYEIYKKKLIIYSLGNFVFDHTYIKSTRKSIIAKIKVCDKGTINIDIIPIISDSKEYHPKIAEKNEKEKILNFISSIRNMIENKSLSEYLLVIGDYKTLCSKYKKETAKEKRIQFVKNIYRYPPDFSVKVIKNYLQKLLN